MPALLYRPAPGWGAPVIRYARDQVRSSSRIPSHGRRAVATARDAARPWAARLWHGIRPRLVGGGVADALRATTTIGARAAHFTHLLITLAAIGGLTGLLLDGSAGRGAAIGCAAAATAWACAVIASSLRHSGHVGRHRTP